MYPDGAISEVQGDEFVHLQKVASSDPPEMSCFQTDYLLQILHNFSWFVIGNTPWRDCAAYRTQVRKLYQSDADI